MEWMELEGRFLRLAEPMKFTRLDIQTGAAGEHFRLAGMPAKQARIEFETIARLAGDRIRELGGVGDEQVDDAPDGLARWYRALQHLSGLARPVVLST